MASSIALHLPRPFRVTWVSWALVAGALVTIGLGLLIASARPAAYPAATPVGTVQSYLGNLQHGRLNRAYDQTTRDVSRTAYTNDFHGWSNTQRGIRLVRSAIDSTTASVTVEMADFSAGPSGSDSATSRVTFDLVRRNGRWLIQSPLYNTFG